MEIQKFANLITTRRKELGLTQAELGQRLGVTDKAVSKWERALSYPDISVIPSLASILHLNVVEILGDQIGDIAQSSNIHNNIPIPGIEDILSANIQLQAEATDVFVSPLLFGCNLEHTRSCVYTGLSAQMLRNRKFAGKPSACSGHAMQWYPIGEKAIFHFDEKAGKAYTCHHEQHRMKRKHEQNAQRIANPYAGQCCGLGQHELSIQENTYYDFRMAVKTSCPVTITVAFAKRHGSVYYVQKQFTIEGDEWKIYEISLISPVTDTDADLRITFTEKASICIGALSLLPSDHFHGMRRDVIACLKETGIQMLRWPGGNFAGDYNWLDGLLPVDMRAPFESSLGIETEPHTLGYDFHEINTDDFIALCREVGAEPYITINPCWNTEEESAAWVEYCNGDESTVYGRLRIERGFPEPYNVKFWSLGNEFGFGHMEGDNSPAGYCKTVMKHAEKMLEVSPDLQLCSSGPYPNAQWVKQSAIPLRGTANLVSQHFYAHDPAYPDMENLTQEYYACLSGVYRLCNQLHQSRRDLPEDVLISLDEWNVWYAWYRPSSVNDGIFTALTLHMIMSEAKACGIELACHFEAINEGLICVTPYTSFLTAQGQMFTLMKQHIGGQMYYGTPDAVITRKDDIFTATIVNASFDQPKQVRLPRELTVQSAVLYTNDTVLPPSFFETQEVETAQMQENACCTIPAHSVMLLKLV